MTVFVDRPVPARPAGRDTDERLERLSAASLRRVIEPETDLSGSVGLGIAIPQELLSGVDAHGRAVI